jgi:hypothetical protein
MKGFGIPESGFGNRKGSKQKQGKEKGSGMSPRSFLFFLKPDA